VSTQEVMSVVKGRGLSVTLVDGRPVLRCPESSRAEITDALLAVLKRHREKIINLLKREGGDA
jgi:hypothetical protein